MFQSNKVNLVISIVAAIVIWAYVVVAINPDETRTIRNVPVNIINEDTLQERGLTLAETDKYTVDVVIKGPRSETTKISADDIEATANVFGYPEGDSEVRVVVTVPDKVTLEDVKPPLIDISIEKHVTASKPVKIKFDGKFKENTEPGFVSVIPENIEVSGAKSAVGDVSYVEATVNSEDVKDTESTVDVKAVPVDKSDEEVYGVSLSQEEISITSTLCHVKTVPLKVPIKGKVSSDYDVTSMKVPEEVTIKGVKSQVDKIKKLKSKSVKISGVKETTEIPLKFDFPDKVELAEISRNISVVVEISGVSVKDFNVSSLKIDLENIKDGYDAYVNEELITVSVYGNQSVIDNLSESELMLSVDMSNADYSKGIYDGTIKCNINKQVNDISIKPATIQVKINETG